MSLDVRAIRRRLRDSLPSVLLHDGEDVSLENADLPVDAPHTSACQVLEGSAFELRTVPGDPEVGFAAFLDGIQTSRVWHRDGGMPIVFGHVAAAIRQRVDRRLVSWGDPVESGKLYAPLSLISDGVRSALERTGVPIIDTLDRRDQDVPHPLQLLRNAYHAVQRDRERVEGECAERWCVSDTRPLFVDGGLPRGERAAASPWCVGVVKSHHTIYAQDQALRALFSLGAGQRSVVFRVEPTWGPAVASWYLKVRQSTTGDPLWGLVRVEIAIDHRDMAALAERADSISRWILAERVPLALPDARWDRMSYGVRDCETFLRARFVP